MTQRHVVTTVGDQPHFGNFLNVLIRKRGGPTKFARDKNVSQQSLRRWRSWARSTDGVISEANQEMLAAEFGYESWEALAHAADTTPTPARRAPRPVTPKHVITMMEKMTHAQRTSCFGDILLRWPKMAQDFIGGNWVDDLKEGRRLKLAEDVAGTIKPDDSAERTAANKEQTYAHKRDPDGPKGKGGK